MLYFMPIGGLANRMRSLDSIISWCEKYEQDLVVLWRLNTELNCSFKDLFSIQESGGITISIIDCPEGFPSNFLRKKEHPLRKNENRLLRRIKNVVKGYKIDEKHKKIIKDIEKLEDDNILENYKSFASIYGELNKDFSGASRILDEIFIDKIEPLLVNFFENKNEIALITSCYRFYPLKNNYNQYNITEKLEKSILEKIKEFNNTYGFHIRRSDHIISKENSSDEKFMKIIDDRLSEESNASFFISTDDEQVKQALILKYKEKILYNKITSYNRSSKNAIRDAILDLYCLSRTKKIYGSHQSSFSQVAADIGGIEEVTVN